ncbi:MAG: DNA polymerase III subunit gamma/tau [Myxococcota bacterium]
MSYQVIARKWRPQSFEEVSGQTHVTRALRNAVRSGRIPHAILFTGPRGVGKTTLARLVARCLNCEKGPTDTPCGVCPSCVEIAEGRSTDVQEIDAASRTGVDDMREIIESIRYAAAPGRHRIFIIDEVHMLSTAAFNALLKTLEEPPPRSLFIFATTNPEKIPFTVLSRCQRHDLRRIALTTVSERLAEICRAEGIAISPKSLAAIAREGEGSMRDAQTLLDQIVAYGGQQVSDEVVAEILDLVDRNVLKSILEACLASDPRSALGHVATATAGGSEPARIAEALLELLRDLTVLQLAPDAEGVFEGTDEERAELCALATRAEPARLRRMFRALVREIEDLAFAPQPRAVLDMAVIRLATMPGGDDVEKLLARLDALERRLAGAERPPALAPAPAPRTGPTAGATPIGSAPAARRDAAREPGRGPAGEPGARGPRPVPLRDAPREAPRSQPPRPPTAPRPTRLTEVPPGLRDEPDEPDPFDAPPAGEPDRFDVEPPAGELGRGDAPDGLRADPERAPGFEATGPAFDEPPAEAYDEEPADDDLEALAPTADRVRSASPGALFDRLRARALELDRARHASLEHADCVAVEGNRMRITASTSFHAERLRARVGELETIAKALFGRPLQLQVEQQTVRKEDAPTAQSRERSRKQRQAALNSESVNLAIEILDAEIVEIRPLGENR